MDCQDVEETIEKRAFEERRVLDHFAGHKADAQARVQVGNREVGVSAGDVNQVTQRAKARLWPRTSVAMNRIDTDAHTKNWRLTRLEAAIAPEILLGYSNHSFVVAFYADRCANGSEILPKRDGNA